MKTLYKKLLYLCFITISYTHANTINLVGDQSTFVPSQNVSVQVNLSVTEKRGDDLWLGIFKKGDKNLRAYVNYRYLRNHKDGLVTIDLPQKVGEYELQLATDDYDKTYSDNTIYIRVESVSPKLFSLGLDKKIVRAEESFNVSLEKKGPLSDSAWIGLFQKSIEAGSNRGYESYHYVRDKLEFTFSAPSQHGDYELRLMDADPGNQILSVPFSVSDKNQSALSEEDKGNKINFNAKPKRQDWAKFALHFKAFTDDDKVRLLNTAKEVKALLSSIDMTDDKAVISFISSALLDGEPYSGIYALFEGQALLNQLDGIAQNYQYADYLNFAVQADRVQKVLFASSWITGLQEFSYKDIDGYQPFKNALFVITDNSASVALKEKVTTNLLDIVGEHKTRDADIAFVTQYYNDFNNVFDLSFE